VSNADQARVTASLPLRALSARDFSTQELAMSVQPFKDRVQAGKLLAQQLDRYTDNPDVIVLALPRGGVPVGFAIAQALHVQLDIMVVRKLGVPWQRELAMGAIAGDGQQIVRNEVVHMLGIDDAVVEEVARQELIELQRRDALYRAGRPRSQLDGRSVILVDDGLATGATMMAAILAVRAQHPAHVVVAVPVGAPDTCKALRTHVDALVCLRMPQSFHAVSVWYDKFPQTADAEVIDLLEQAQHLPHAVTAAVRASTENAQPSPAARP
jgi:putative phosphoribosyl transferase